MMSTPLSTAVENGCMGAIQLLIDNGADMYKCDPIKGAIRNNQYDAVKLLIDNGLDINIEIDGDPCSRIHGNIDIPIGMAIYYGHIDIIKLLLNSDIDPDFLDCFGSHGPAHTTRICMFSYAYDFSILSLMEEYGYDTLKDANGEYYLGDILCYGVVLEFAIEKGLDVNAYYKF